MVEQNTSKYLPFYQGIFSQWHRCNFVDTELSPNYCEHSFTSAEQYMMFCKAYLFNDIQYADAILKQNDCRKIKALGRQIRGFDEKTWEIYKEDVVARGNYLKFSQNPKLKIELLKTQGKCMLEASPYDCIWGVGLRKGDKNIQNPLMWRGLNLLGKCLDRARELILSLESDKVSLVSDSYNSDSDSDSCTSLVHYSYDSN